MQVEDKKESDVLLKIILRRDTEYRGLPAVIILNSLLAAYHVNKTKKKHKVRTRMKQQNTGERRNSAQVREEAKRTREKKTARMNLTTLYPVVI